MNEFDPFGISDIQRQQAEGDANFAYAVAMQRGRMHIESESQSANLLQQLTETTTSAQAWQHAAHSWKERALADEQRLAKLKARDAEQGDALLDLSEIIASLRHDRCELMADLGRAYQHIEDLQRENSELVRDLKAADRFAMGLANGLDALVAEARACSCEHPLSEITTITLDGEEQSLPAVAKIVYADQN